MEALNSLDWSAIEWARSVCGSRCLTSVPDSYQLVVFGIIDVGSTKDISFLPVDRIIYNATSIAKRNGPAVGSAIYPCQHGRDMTVIVTVGEIESGVMPWLISTCRRLS